MKFLMPNPISLIFVFFNMVGMRIILYKWSKIRMYIINFLYLILRVRLRELIYSLFELIYLHRYLEELIKIIYDILINPF